MSRELIVEGLNVLKMFSANKSKEPHFGMFSKRGNKAVNDIVVEVMKHPTATDEQKYKMADAMLAKLRVRFGEAQDTAVRDAVWTAISSQPLNEDGHTDVPSSMRMCMTIIEDAQDILEELRQGEMDKSIDTWWTNKLAVSASSLNKLRDYITNKIQD